MQYTENRAGQGVTVPVQSEPCGTTEREGKLGDLGRDRSTEACAHHEMAVPVTVY